ARRSRLRRASNVVPRPRADAVVHVPLIARLEHAVAPDRELPAFTVLLFAEHYDHALGQFPLEGTHALADACGHVMHHARWLICDVLDRDVLALARAILEELNRIGAEAARVGFGGVL